MSDFNKLPKAEFELMKVIWAGGSGHSAPTLANNLRESKNWTQQTVLTLLNRLERRGFLRSVKTGKERVFSPLVSEEEYVWFESKLFLKVFHQGSMAGMIRALYAGKELNQKDFDELKQFLDERG